MREAFDDGRFSHAGFADQHRIILGAALQHLDGTADFVVTTNDRIELSLTGALGEIHRVFFQCLALALGFLILDAIGAAHREDRGFKRLLVDAVLLEGTARLTLVVQ